MVVYQERDKTTVASSMSMNATEPTTRIPARAAAAAGDFTTYRKPSSSNTATTSEEEEEPDDTDNENNNNSSNDDDDNPAHANTIVYRDAETNWSFAKNPDRVEELISKEMMQLSLENRNHIQDELHGVGCMAPDETPELLESSLAQLRHELDAVVPLAQKKSYLRAKQEYPRSYVHGDDFKLRFLRFDLFDVPKAAVRLTYYMDLLADVYGEYALQRPVRLSDFTRDELHHLRQGHIQVLPERDRGGAGTGRRIFVLFPDKEWEDIPPRIRHKIFIYTVWVEGNDPDTQRKGIVLVGWFDQNATPSWKPKFRSRANQILSLRISGIHICTPDTPYYRLRRALVMMTAGKLRSHMKVHTGDAMELRYSLKAYGFPSEKIPITDTGSIKTVNLRKWIKLRWLLEGGDDVGGSINNNNHNNYYNYNHNNYYSDLVYSPYLTDVTFRKGRTMASQPGNLILKQTIRTKIENGDLDRLPHCQSKTRMFIQEVLEDMNRKHRSDIMNGKGGTHPQNPAIRLLEWSEKQKEGQKDIWKRVDMNNDDVLYYKLRQVVKGIEKSVKEERKGNTTKTKKNHDTKNNTTAKHPPSKDLGSATSIFLNNTQDNPAGSGGFCGCSSSSAAAALRAVKKQKLDTEGHGKTTTTIFDGDPFECFGRKFLPLPLLSQKSMATSPIVTKLFPTAKSANPDIALQCRAA